MDVLDVEEFVLSWTSGSVGQLEAPPTICPWIAVPSTVPSTSTIIPEGNTDIQRQTMNDSTCVNLWNAQED